MMNVHKIVILVTSDALFLLSVLHGQKRMLLVK